MKPARPLKIAGHVEGYAQYVTAEQRAQAWRGPVFIRDPELAVFRDLVLDLPYERGSYEPGADREALTLRIQDLVLRHERKLARLRHEVEAFEHLPAGAPARREAISEAVRVFVWQRDRGQCSRCGRRERLEFDHIVPVADGGSSTERNVQLLCEPCNRSKGRGVA